MEPGERISSFEIDPAADSGGESPTQPFWTRPEYQPTEKIRRSWMRRPTPEPKKIKYDKIFLWTGGLILNTVLVAGLTILVGGKKAPSHYPLLPEDNYTVALRKALTFFNAQRSGKLPEHNNVSWRGDSCLNDGTAIQDLVGGFYDAGHAIKFNFPASFAMTMLSWSVLEYSAKYEAAGELNHVKEIIKWGNDYFLKTFNNSADKIDRIASQVGVRSSFRASPHNDIYCWVRPEDIVYPRPVSEYQKCSDLAAEMAAALAAASIVFNDDAAYSQQFVHGARILFEFSRDQLGIYSNGDSDAASFYNSSGYWDEIIWGGAWMYYATGNDSYLEIATDPKVAKLVGAGQRGPHFGVLNWDNKLVGAQVLLTRLRMFLSPGYPYEEVLKILHEDTIAAMCSYLPYFSSFNRTRGGLIVLDHGAPKSLQHVVNAAFLATLYSDYLVASESGGWDCGATFYRADVLRDFSTTQVQYILGKNPRNMSYLVGYGERYLQHFSHRGASIPDDNVTYTCKGGWRWRDTLKPNPNILVGAMVGSPDQHDEFNDTRTNKYTEPTLAGNSGLVAALVGLSGDNRTGINKNLIFSRIRPMFLEAPPPPAPWKP